MRISIAGVVLALSCVLAPFSSTAHASTLTLHARFVDRALNAEFRFTKAVVLPHGTSDEPAPKGGAIVLIYATVRNLGQGGAYYQMVDFVGAASAHGPAFKFVPYVRKYQPALTGNLLSAREHQSGWFGYAVPAGMKTLFVRFKAAGEVGGGSPILKVPLHH